MKLKTKLKRTKKAVGQFNNQLKKNFVELMKKMKSIWVMPLFVLCLMATVQSCNVTRVVTTRSEYQQKGDTTIMIQTKTTESYDASKKLNLQ